MATIYDLIEVTGIAPDTTYSFAAGNVLGVIDGASGASLDDGEFDEGDTFVINGVSYNIDRIQEPASSGRFTLEDGSQRSFDPGSESNLSAIFLTVSKGGDVRHFIIPNDSYGDMDIAEIRTGSLTDVSGNDAAIISTTNNTVNVVCFTSGSRIETPSGAVAVQLIRRGDLVLTLDHGPQQVMEILTQTINLTTAPDRVKPVVFDIGSLGQNRPNLQLGLSPQHRLLLTDKNGTPVLVPAKALLGRPGVRVMQGKGRVSYYHLVFSRHEVIWANGTPSESFYPGPMALAIATNHLATSKLMASCAGPAAAPILRVQDARRADFDL